MADEQDEQQKKEIYGASVNSNELEEGSAQLAEKISNEYFGHGKETETALVFLASIAISLKKIAEEANSATANMYQGQMK